MADESPVTAPQPTVQPKPRPKPRPKPEVVAPKAPLLRDRLIAALRPRMTLVEARMTADQLVDDVAAYGLECASAALQDQAAAVGLMVAAAQDCLEIMSAGPGEGKR